MGFVSLVGHILDIPFSSNTTPPLTAPPPTVDSPQVIEIGSLVGAVIGTFIGTSLLYTVILLVWILWNKRHRYLFSVLLHACALLTCDFFTMLYCVGMY